MIIFRLNEFSRGKLFRSRVVWKNFTAQNDYNSLFFQEFKMNFQF